MTQTAISPLRAQTILVTGATSGIGFHVARELIRMGATVYITGRNYQRGQQAEAALRQSAPQAQVHFLPVDHSTVGANQQLTRQLRERTDVLHVLVNNVGALYNDRTVTNDGYEASLAVNAIAPFVLTEALFPLLEAGSRTHAPARVVNVVSRAFKMWRDDPFADLQAAETYTGLRAYARAKLLTVLWTLALARRTANQMVIINAVNPGVAWTTLNQQLAPRAMPLAQRLFWPMFRFIQKRGSVEQAASPVVLLASSKSTAMLNGTYVESNGHLSDVGATVRQPQLQDRAVAVLRELIVHAPTNIERGVPQPA